MHQIFKIEFKFNIKLEIFEAVKKREVGKLF